MLRRRRVSAGLHLQFSKSRSFLSFFHCLYYLRPSPFETWQDIINISQLHKSAIAEVQVFAVVINDVIFAIILIITDLVTCKPEKLL